MERLTEKNPLWIDDELWERACEPDCEEIDAVYRKLKEYEDAEEQGLLLRLPCKVGDKIYIVFHNHTIGKSTVVSFKMIAKGWAVKTNDWSYLFTDFGKTVFLTKSEAEAKLKEMEDSHDGE